MAAPDDSVAQFGYWNIRGLGQSVRYVLNYCEVQYDERSYDFGENNDSREGWLKEKFSLGLDFPNLPYLKVGDVKLTQSLAILRYLARRGGLFPQTEEAQQRVDVVEQQVNDIIWACVFVCYGEDYSDQKKEEYVKQFQELRCTQLEKFLGDRNYVAGEQLTYVDFLLWEMLDQHRTLWPEYEKMYAKTPKLEAYLKRIEELPKMAKFLESEKCIIWPVWSEKSLHGGPRMSAPKRPVKY